MSSLCEPVTFRDTSYVPGDSYTWTGFSSSEYSPSPKDHSLDAIVPVVCSSNLTWSGVVPSHGSAENDDTTGVIT